MPAPAIRPFSNRQTGSETCSHGNAADECRCCGAVAVRTMLVNALWSHHKFAVQEVIMRFSLSLLVFAFLTPPAPAANLPQLSGKLKPTQMEGTRTLIVTALGEPLYLEQIRPANIEMKRKQLSQREFESWLNGHLGRRTYEHIWNVVKRSRVKRNKLEISKTEIASIAAAAKRELKSSPRQSDASNTADLELGIMVAWRRASLMDWKVCKSLYEKYGGRVGIGSLGAWTAFDGQNALIREHREKGDVTFHHEGTERAFLQYTKIDNFADVFPKGERLKKLLNTPPNMR